MGRLWWEARNSRICCWRSSQERALITVGARLTIARDRKSQRISNIDMCTRKCTRHHRQHGGGVDRSFLVGLGRVEIRGLTGKRPQTGTAAVLCQPWDTAGLLDPSKLYRKTEKELAEAILTSSRRPTGRRRQWLISIVDLNVLDHVDLGEFGIRSTPG